MRKSLRLLALIFAINICPWMFSESVWQWSVPVRNFTPQPKRGPARAWMWVGDTCTHINAVLVAQHNMEEIQIMEDKGFRDEMSRQGIAQVWVCPSFNHGFDFTDGAWETLDGILSDLASVSGYEEVASAPLIGIGHSAAASWPYYLAAYKPERVAACLSVSGQWPYWRDEDLCPDIWGERNIDFIPSLETMGEYESAESWKNNGLKQRREHPHMPLSMLACPAEGHFSYSPEKTQYLALFIKKALQYGHVDPTVNGWLMEGWSKDKQPTIGPAPVTEYRGNKDEAFWFFDNEMVDATLEYQSRYSNRKPQLVSVAQNGEVVPQRKTHLQVHPQFLPGEDGISMKLEPVFLDTVPGGSPRLKSWTHLPVGSSISHSQDGLPYFKMISGPGRFVDDGTTLQVCWDRGTQWKTSGKAQIVFAIMHPGDDQYIAAVQQAQIDMPCWNNQGHSQTISFAQIPDVDTSQKSVDLEATSTSGLPVRFYVETGPAYVEGNKLIITPIPPKSKFPVEITVVAWQYGRTGDNPIATAIPVRRTFRVIK